MKSCQGDSFFSSGNRSSGTPPPKRQTTAKWPNPHWNTACGLTPETTNADQTSPPHFPSHTSGNPDDTKSTGSLFSYYKIHHITGKRTFVQNVRPMTAEKPFFTPEEHAELLSLSAHCVKPMPTSSPVRTTACCATASSSLPGTAHCRATRSDSTPSSHRCKQPFWPPPRSGCGATP